jgi:O-antigen/teichoic acid export membrane protein
MLGDLISSGFIAIATSIANFLGVFTFARFLDPVAFGLFSTCRRFGAFLAPFANLNGHLAVSRYLGYFADERRARTAIFLVGLGLVLVIPAVTFAVLAGLRSFSGQIQWLRELDASVWSATAWLTSSLSLSLVVFSMLRGWGHPLASNLQQFTFVASLLCLAAFAGRLTVPQLVQGAAVLGFLVSISFLLWVGSRHRKEMQRPHARDIWQAARHVVRYSLPRIGDGPFQASLSLIGVVMAPSIGGLVLAGYIHIGQTLVRMTEVLIVPLSVIFLPLTARNVRAGKRDVLRKQSQMIYDGICLVGIFGFLQALVWVVPLLDVFFDQKYAGAETFLLVTTPAIFPYLLYAGFRSFIDGYSVRPVNFIHLTVAVAVVAAGSVLSKLVSSPIGLALAYTAGVSVLGFLSILFVRRELQIRLVSKELGHVLLGAGGTMLASLGVRHWVPAGSMGMTLGLFAVTSSLMLGLYVVYLLRARHATVVFTQQRLRSARSKTEHAVAQEASDEERRSPVVAGAPADEWPGSRRTREPAGRP